MLLGDVIIKLSRTFSSMSAKRGSSGPSDRKIVTPKHHLSEGKAKMASGKKKTGHLKWLPEWAARWHVGVMWRLRVITLTASV